jgi:hypothetical protein
MNKRMNKGMNEEEFELFLHKLFEEIHRKYGNGFYRSKL